METLRTNTGDVVAVTPVQSIDWKARAIAAESRAEALEYVVAYANDIVNLWPSITMRTLWQMTNKVAGLRA